MIEYRFGKRSLEKLETCDDRLKVIAVRAIEITPFDFTIVHGWRDEETQNELVRMGMSKTRWPTSKHNQMKDGQPWSQAIDVAPYFPELQPSPIPWKDTHTFAVLAGVFFAAAKERGLQLRWGGDWNMNGLTGDQTFMDWGHLELV